MKKTKVVRFAPSREGTLLASTWRLWVQGDGCYLAGRDTASIGKISFHRNFNWQYRVGSALHRLAPPLKRSDGWSHGVQLAFFVDDDVIRPFGVTDAPHLRFEIPCGHKGLVNILFSPRGIGATARIPGDFGGTVLGQLPLRSGSAVVATATIAERTAQENAFVHETREKLRINLTEPPAPGEFFAEATWFNSNREAGNIVAVIPVGLDSVVVDRP